MEDKEYKNPLIKALHLTKILLEKEKEKLEAKREALKNLKEIYNVSGMERVGHKLSD